MSYATLIPVNMHSAGYSTAAATGWQASLCKEERPSMGCKTELNAKLAPLAQIASRMSVTQDASRHNLQTCQARQKARRRQGRRGAEERTSDVADLEEGGEVIFSLGQGWKEGYRDLARELAGREAYDDVSVMSSEGVRGRARPASSQVTREATEAAPTRKTEGESGKLPGRAPGAGNGSSIEELRTTHKMLKVMAGNIKGKRLLSPADRNVRPMMEMVRGAVFNMIQALASSPGFLPGGRWLDLYSGTGSVGIEAISRGCEEAHFVEMDPWVVSTVLRPNLVDCNYDSRSTIHTSRVELFLERIEKQGAPSIGGPFEFVSVTPPYEAVVYSELLGMLSRSPLLKDSTCMIVEYPLLSKQGISDFCGPLAKLRDRKYGRTNVAIYGPKWLLDE